MADEEDEGPSFDDWGEMVSEKEIEVTTEPSDREYQRKTPEEYREQYEEEIERAQDLFEKVKGSQSMKYNGEECFGMHIEDMLDFLVENGFYNPRTDYDELREDNPEEFQKKLAVGIPTRIYRIFGEAGKWRDPTAEKNVIRAIGNPPMDGRDEHEYLLIIYPDYFVDAYGDTKFERYVAGKQRAYTRVFKASDLAKSMKEKAGLSDDEMSPEFIENVNRKIVEEGMNKDFDEYKEEKKEKRQEEAEEEEPEEEEE